MSKKKKDKKELHLLVNRKLVEYAWQHGLNLSAFLENQLRQYFKVDENKL